MFALKSFFGAGRAVLGLGLLAGVVAFGTSTASAAIESGLPAGGEKLTDFLSGGTFTGVQIGNFIFSNFSFTPVTSSPTASSVALNSSVSGVGLTFSAPWSAASGSSNESIISYEVTAVSGVINSMEYDYNGQVLAASTGTLTQVGETLTNNSSSQIGKSTDSNGPAGPLKTTLSITTPQSPIFVATDVLAASGTGGASSISAVNNTFTQQTVPEPATLGLMGIFGLTVLARRRKV